MSMCNHIVMCFLTYASYNHIILMCWNNPCHTSAISCSSTCRYSRPTYGRWFISYIAALRFVTVYILFCYTRFQVFTVIENSYSQTFYLS